MYQLNKLTPSDHAHAYRLSCTPSNSAISLATDKETVRLPDAVSV